MFQEQGQNITEHLDGWIKIILFYMQPYQLYTGPTLCGSKHVTVKV